MGNLSPGYKSYKVPGCNGVIPGWLIKHRGEEIDRAVTAATNALVEADLLRNTKFSSENTNPIINPDKSFKILSIIPTEIRDIANDANTCLDNQFEFSFIDERFINKDKLSYDPANDDAELRSILRYKETSTTTLSTIVEQYLGDNPSRSTLWGSIKAARDILLNQPLSPDNSNKVLITQGSKATWGQISSGYIANDAILTKHISDGQITTGKIASLAVTTEKIANEAITTDKLGLDVSNKLQDLADGIAAFKTSISMTPNSATTNGVVQGITYNNSEGKFSVTYGAVKTEDISESAISEGKLQANAVTRTKIANSAINNDKIDDLAITTAKIQDSAITTAKIDDNAITNDKLANDISTDKIKVGTSTNSGTLSAKLKRLTDDVAGFKGSLSIDPTPASAAGVVKRITYNSSDGKFSVAYSTVTTDDIADANITKEKIADGSIHSEHLSAALITYLENLKPSEPNIGDDVILDCGEFITLDASATPSNPDDGVQEDDIIFNCGNTEE